MICHPLTEKGQIFQTVTPQTKSGVMTETKTQTQYWLRHEMQKVAHQYCKPPSTPLIFSNQEEKRKKICPQGQWGIGPTGPAGRRNSGQGPGHRLPPGGRGGPRGGVLRPPVRVKPEPGGGLGHCGEPHQGVRGVGAVQDGADVPPRRVAAAGARGGVGRPGRRGRGRDGQGREGPLAAPKPGFVGGGCDRHVRGLGGRREGRQGEEVRVENGDGDDRPEPAHRDLRPIRATQK
mmetsp:Transcript_9768/g.20653  ORF Transcript_9768/g.20653 Transcript_9768/m.20653 type:complete len:234 (+) Transcript_9768:158-859(+)